MHINGLGLTIHYGLPDNARNVDVRVWHFKLYESVLSMVQELGLEDCNQMCFKDPVLKDQQWSAYIDRSPGAASYSEDCFRACVSGCGYKFEVVTEEVDKVCPNRPPKPAPVQKPKPQPIEPVDPPEEMPGISA
ncbi:hypothetical protein Ahy_A10g051069 isoform B [Arachis hypogaea]|uniref:Uncharacterized protein n=1 Tax=Arachis hypogaea TaxID=3818 RepID=A0A445BBF7_ARAHY|nr:hypothetical protein Ahy_A10g051069 isoform B [Arachis hypogaea]